MWVVNILNCIQLMVHAFAIFVHTYIDIYQKRVFWPAYAVSTCCFYFQILIWEAEGGRERPSRFFFIYSLAGGFMWLLRIVL